MRKFISAFDLKPFQSSKDLVVFGEIITYEIYYISTYWIDPRTRELENFYFNIPYSIVNLRLHLWLCTFSLIEDNFISRDAKLCYRH